MLYDIRKGKLHISLLIKAILSRVLYNTITTATPWESGYDALYHWKGHYVSDTSDIMNGAIIPNSMVL